MRDKLDFIPFPKIPRWSSQHIVITEKIDGTNAQIVINDDCNEIRAGSRSAWITPDKDNYGFARWVEEHRDDLLKLGKGQHFGEWWGYGIQRSYNLREKRFSLFNTLRWATSDQQERLRDLPVGLVPILYQGPFSDSKIAECLEDLEKNGSRASPGFQNPEGVVIYIPGSRSLFKKTIGYDGHKGQHGDNHEQPVPYWSGDAGLYDTDQPRSERAGATLA